MAMKMRRVNGMGVNVARLIRLVALVALVSSMHSGFASQREQEAIGGLTLPTLLDEACSSKASGRVDVFDKPGGSLKGYLLRKVGPEKKEACVDLPELVLVMGEMRGAEVGLFQTGYEIYSLAVHSEVRVNGKLWVSGKAGSVTFWIEADNGRVFMSLERDLAKVIERVEEMCLADGTCERVNDAMSRTLAKAAKEFSCFKSPYEVARVVTMGNGRLAYEGFLVDEVSAKYGSVIPKKVLVPTRSADGRATGGFYPRGC